MIEIIELNEIIEAINKSFNESFDIWFDIDNNASFNVYLI